MNTNALLEQLQKGWHWVPGWIDEGVGESGRAVLFEREIDLTTGTDGSLLHISADTRYKLCLNSNRICVGPARGTQRQWFYDTIPLPPLAQGKHLIQVIVQRFFFSCPGATTFARTRNPGLTIVGSVGGVDLSLEDRDWRVRIVGEKRLLYKLPFDVFLNDFEEVSPTPSRLNWVRPERCRILRHFGVQTPWLLQPRMIPLAEETALSPCAVRYAEGPVDEDTWRRFFLHGTPIRLPPESTLAVEIEFPVHSTAFWRLEAMGSAIIKVIYSEAYEKMPLRGTLGGPSHLDHPVKHIRDDRTGSGLTGPYDILRTQGKTTYEPFWWRTFRFIRFEIETQGEVILETFETTQTNYPFNNTATWSSTGGTKQAEKIWEVSVRTLRNCVFDGYSDCPFYEQLQYAADTRLQILFHYYLTGDDRLARQAITAFAASAQPDGLVEARTPAHGTQIIPGFALHWILIVVDHWEHYADVHFIRPLLPLIDGVLDYFARQTTSRGLVENLPKKYWSFIDWHEDWQATPDFNDSGVPVQGRKTGTFTFFTLFYAYTLRSAQKLETVRPGFGYDYTERAYTAISAAQEYCFNGEYFTDTVTAELDPFGGPGLSQHCQIFAVLSGALDIFAGKHFLAASVDPSNRFTPCSYTFQHYLLRAAAKVDLYPQVSEEVWRPFQDMLSKHLTTWEETPGVTRSDCHAWASLPLFEFPAEVAGLTPATPGWGKVCFAPRLDMFDSIDATIAMGTAGKARIRWSLCQGKKQVTLDLPVAKDVHVRLGGETKLVRLTKTLHLVS